MRAKSRYAAVLAAACCAVAGPSAVALASSADQSVAYQLNATHDGYLAGAPLGTPLTQAWSVPLPGASSYPLVVNGAVFVTAADKTLYALNQATGATLWSHGLGGTYPWSGLAYDRGQVFVVTSSGLLTAFDPATGAINWSVQLPGQSSFSSAPTAAGGIVYTGGAGSGGTLYATRESDGHLMWSAPVENGDNSSPAVDAQAVYVTYACSQDYAFAPVTGSLLWHHTTACEGGGGKTPVVAAGTVFGRDAPTGNVALSTLAGSVLGPFTAGPAPAVAGGSAYMLSGTTLSAIANSGLGTSSWSFAGDNHLVTAPLVVGGLVFVGSSTGMLYALDAAAGTISWSANVGVAIPPPDEQNVSQPLTGLGAGNGTLVVPSATTVMAYRTAGAITDPPANQAPPTIDGSAQSGQLLAVDVGVWSGLPSSYSYQWRLCDAAGANCADIAGATGASLNPTAPQAGSTVRVVVVATNLNGASAAATSGPSAVIHGSPPVSLSAPLITGATTKGVTLGATVGTWSATPTGYSYQWRRCFSSTASSCSDIIGATLTTYTLAVADVGDRIAVRVIAASANGASDPADSALSQTVTSGTTTPTTTTTPPPPEVPTRPVIKTAPLLTGTAQVGNTLTVTSGDWYYSPTAFSYQWIRCEQGGTACANIAGATAATYRPVAADLGKGLAVGVTASNAAGASTPARVATKTMVMRGPDNTLTLLVPQYRPDGSLTLVARVKDQGTLTVVANTTTASLGLCRTHCKSIVYGTSTLLVKQTQFNELRVKPVAKARKAIAAGRAIHLTLTVTFQSALGGPPTSHTRSLVMRARHRSKVL